MPASSVAQGSSHSSSLFPSCHQEVTKLPNSINMHISHPNLIVNVMLLTLGMLRMSPRSPAFSAARNCCFGLNLRFFRASDASHTYKCIVVLFLFISFLISAVEQVEGLGLKIFCGRTFYFCNKQRQQRCAFPLAAFKPSAAG